MFDVRWDLGHLVAARVQDRRGEPARVEAVDDEGAGRPSAADDECAAGSRARAALGAGRRARAALGAGSRACHRECERSYITTLVRAITLRPWQRDALEAFRARRSPDFLAVACPGAGKTTFALAALRQDLRTERRAVVVVVPTQHLKHQWAHAALRFGLHLEADWQWRMGLPADMHGVIVTYSQASTSAKSLARLAHGGIAVLDELHHAASERSWGDGVRTAFADADCRLLLSGTPFRTDDHPIPFVTYS
ncbi:MAG: DEAD/DEAH box helicase [Actinobacteria bacterium]|nr:MAG: DEAD/DEAH box helicase [Actinomycetota bacterium]